MTEKTNETARNSTERIRSLLVLVATLGTVAFSWMSAAGYINGTTPGQISDKYHTIVTPAEYAFTIWFLIYAGLIAFSIYQLLPTQLERFQQIRSLYIASCVLNCIWIYFWHAEAIVVCFVIVCVLWLVLFVIDRSLVGVRGTAETWIVRAPFSFYFGWIDVVLVVNLVVMLVYMDKMPSGSSASLLGAALLGLSGITAVIIRILFGDFFFPLTVAWGATAIAIKNSGETAIVVTTAVVLVVCLVTTGSIVTTLKDSTSE